MFKGRMFMACLPLMFLNVLLFINKISNFDCIIDNRNY